MRRGSWPIKSGARLSSITEETARGAPYANASPVPVSPSSVVTRTTICLRVAPVHADGGESGFSGMARGMAWIAAIFIELGSVVDRCRAWRGRDAQRIEDVAADPIEETAPVVDAEHPSIEPGAGAVDRAALVVVPTEELVVSAVVPLDRRREGAERLVHHRRDLHLRSEDEARVTQDLLPRPDVLGDDDHTPRRERGRAGDAERAPYVRRALLVGPLHVQDGHVGRERGDQHERRARPRIGARPERRIRLEQPGAEDRARRQVRD